MLGLDIDQAIVDQAKLIGRLYARLDADQDAASILDLSTALLVVTQAWEILIRVRDARTNRLQQLRPTKDTPVLYDDDDDE